MRPSFPNVKKQSFELKSIFLKYDVNFCGKMTIDSIDLKNYKYYKRRKRARDVTS